MRLSDTSKYETSVFIFRLFPFNRSSIREDKAVIQVLNGPDALSLEYHVKCYDVYTHSKTLSNIQKKRSGLAATKQTLKMIPRPGAVDLPKENEIVEVCLIFPSIDFIISYLRALPYLL